MNLRWSLERLNNTFEDLFDLLVLPDGVDKPTFIDTLLLEYGQFGIACPLDRIRGAIGTWSKRHEYELKGLWATTQQVYNPVENYDRIEDITDTKTGSNTSQTDSTGKTTSVASVTDTTAATGSGQTENKVSAYNAATYDPSNSGTESSKSDTKTDSNSNSTTDSNNGTKGTGSYNESNTHTAHVHGNIGVTTAAQMLQGEREIVHFDFYKTAANVFANDLLIGIWL